MTADAFALDDRALSQATLAAVGFGATVLLIAAVGVLLLQTGGNLDDGGPSITLSADPVDPADGRCCQRVRVHHDAGATIGLQHLEVLVTFSDDDRRSRLTDLPTDVLEQGDYRGHHVFSLGDVGVGGVADSDTASDGTFAAGDTIAFRIEPTRLDLRSGESVTVTVFNGTSEARLGQVTATVRDG